MNSIKRILIANRGEIACRIIRSCKHLGIESVAVYSEADRHAQHVQQADLACYIGGSQANESYLNAQVICEAALKVKADAIHPGYGFLSESTELISRCEESGLIFIGPSLENISQMGLKIEAKIIANKLNIPTVPGYNGENQDSARLKKAAKAIGYPLLIKASAGGGGKGMRIVNQASEFEETLTLVQQESLKAFGNDKVLLEKYIVRPRHIEVQVLGDAHGNIVHLFDRECSIQRNYQKVIEEAPVCHLSDEVRQSLFDCAVRLGQYLNYRGAGTIEFIYDADTSKAYFLEMNTRLQVEHPTTELVTGVDLVEWQIRIAQGEKLCFSQEDLNVHGHAIETRVNAEDPANNYMPETGTITLYREPVGDGLRIDSGIAMGSEITPFYDSMVAKVIAFAETRGLATQRLLHGLNNYAIGGVKTNQEFLTSLIVRPAFHQELTTQYISNEFPDGWHAWGEDLHIAVAAAAYALSLHNRPAAQLFGTPWQSLGGWRLTTASGTPAVTKLWLLYGKELLEIELTGNCGEYNILVNNTHFPISIHHGGNTPQQWQVEVENTKRSLDIYIDNQQVSISSPRLNRSYNFIGLEDSQLCEAVVSKDSGSTICAVMPGQITDVLVAEGDLVEKGQTAVLMEAMKMIHRMTAPCSGIVKTVQCAMGDNVPDGYLLVEIDKEG